MSNTERDTPLASLEDTHPAPASGATACLVSIYGPSLGRRWSLDRDDTDGAGPEIIQLAALEEGTYRVGVYYWTDNDFGPSFATVRIYVDGALAFESAEVGLAPQDFWEVATITGPNAPLTIAEVRGCTNEPTLTCAGDEDCPEGGTCTAARIASDYVHPSFNPL